MLIILLSIITVISWIIHSKHSPFRRIDGGISEALVFVIFMVLFELATGLFGLWLIFFGGHWLVGVCLTSYLLRLAYGAFLIVTDS